MQEGYKQCLGAQEGATEGKPVGLGPEKLAAGEGTESLRYPALQYTVSETSIEGFRWAPPHHSLGFWAPSLSL